MKPIVRQYLAEIGRRGGRKSRRVLSPEEARRMVTIRENRRAYRKLLAQIESTNPPLATAIGNVDDTLLGDFQKLNFGERIRFAGSSAHTLQGFRIQ